jgi:pyridoxamine 5'-phosphate oxidase
MPPTGRRIGSDVFDPDLSLDDPLPGEPMETLGRWLEDVTVNHPQHNATAVALATVDPDGRPSARMVICRGFDLERGFFVFYTDRRSHKGTALESCPRAALVFWWPPIERQVRIEGPVTLSPDDESDAYFGSRPLDAQVGAWSSVQSRSIASRSDLLRAMDETAGRYGVRLDPPRGGPLPRPEFWGGYRVWAETVELWVGRPGRIHDRGLWSRPLARDGDGWRGGAWRVERLQP